MADRYALPVAVVLLMGMNLAYAGWAMSVPPDEGWMYYLEMPVPPEVGADAHPDVMAARLVAAGYTVDPEFSEGASFVTLTATHPDDPAFRTVFGGAPGPGWTFIMTEVFCRVGYLWSDCPADLEEVMRAEMQAAVGASGSALDVAPAHLGDNDFAMWTSFGLTLGLLGVRGVSALILLGVAAVNGELSGGRAALAPVPPPVAAGGLPPEQLGAGGPLRGTWKAKGGRPPSG